jgi:Protein tyrosine and serine/threonine kinase
MSDAGKMFGPFELLEVIAETSFGISHRARQTADGLMVEVLLLDPRAAARADYLQRFLRQAQAASQVSHPHLTVVGGAGEVEGRYYLVTETTDGGTVGDLLRTAGALPEPDAVRIARDCALGLKAAWNNAGLAHGGVSVEEIRLQPGGAVKLAGWALARSPEGSFLGDVQALGGALYQMLLNEPPPLPGHGLGDLADKRPGTGLYVTEVIEKMRQPASWNYTAYDALIEDLEALLDQRQPQNTRVALSLGTAPAPQTTATPPPAAPVTTPLPPAMRRRRGGSVFGSLLKTAFLLLVAGGAGWGTWTYFHNLNSEPLPLPPAPATPREPIALAPAVEPKTATPTFEEIADPVERGRAMAKSVGVARIQPQFGGVAGVLADGQVHWLYAFQNNAELNDFPEGSPSLQDGALRVQRSRVKFKCPLRGDLTLDMDGRLVEADANAPWRALGVAWHQGDSTGRGFVLTAAGAELYETVDGKRVVLATAPYELKPGTPVHYRITQRGTACAVKLTDGSLLVGTFTRPAEGALRLVSDGSVTAFTRLEITGTVPADRLLMVSPQEKTRSP